MRPISPTGRWCARFSATIRISRQPSTAPALIVVPESVAKPYEYYKENVIKSMEFFSSNPGLSWVRNGCLQFFQLLFMTLFQALCHRKIPPAPAQPLLPHQVHDGNGAKKTSAALRPERKSLCATLTPLGLTPKWRTGLHIRYPSHLIGKRWKSRLDVEPVFQPDRHRLAYPRWFRYPRLYSTSGNLAQAQIRAGGSVLTVSSSRVAKRRPLHSYQPRHRSGVTVKEFCGSFSKMFYGQKLRFLCSLPARAMWQAFLLQTPTRAARLLGWESGAPN